MYQNLNVLDPSTALGQAIRDEVRKDNFKLVCYDKSVVGDQIWYPLQYTRKYFVIETFVGISEYDLGGIGNTICKHSNPIDAIIGTIASKVKCKLMNQGTWPIYREALPQLPFYKIVDLPKTIDALWAKGVNALFIDLMDSVVYKF